MGILELAKEMNYSSPLGLKWAEVQEFRKGKIEVSQMEKRLPDDYDCAFIDYFLEDNSDGMITLKCFLKKFRRDICIELMQWLFGRDNCGYLLYDMKEIDGKIVFEELSTEYDVCSVHWDYGNLMYTKKTNFCPLHGILSD